MLKWRGVKGAKVVLITDFPTYSDEVCDTLISGDEGTLLESALPCPISEVLIIPLCPFRPDNNNFSYINGSSVLDQSISLIKSYLSQSPPNLIITLGPEALRYFGARDNVYTWRASPLHYEGIKLMANHHPREVLQNRTLYSTFSLIFKKAFDYKDGKETIYKDNFRIISDPMEQMNVAQEIIKASHDRFVTVDIENRRDNLDLLCVGFGLSRDHAICFEVRSEATYNILRDMFPKLGKVIYHNALWDMNVFSYKHQINSPIPYIDTMVAQHVLQLELPRGLDYLCQTMTWREAYWASVTFDDFSKSHAPTIADKKRDQLSVYNCKDVCVTYEAAEIFIVEDRILENQTFIYEMDMLEVSMHMGQTGMLVDQERRELLRKAQADKRQYDYDTLFAATGQVFTVSQHAKIKELLYIKLKLPEKKNKKGVVTTDADALVSLLANIKEKLNTLKTDASIQEWKIKYVIVRVILSLRGYDKLLTSYLNNELSPDGRFRSLYKVTGTETGRWSAALWIDGTGGNGQTAPRESLEVNIEGEMT